LKYSKLRTEFFAEFDKQRGEEKKPEEARKTILQAKKKIIKELGKIVQREKKEAEISELGSAANNLIALIENIQNPLNRIYREIEKFIRE
jgi:hypothetical protein